MEDFSQKDAKKAEKYSRPNSILEVRELVKRGDKDALGALLNAADVPVATRRVTAKALGEIASIQQSPVFINALRADPDRAVRLNAALVLGRLADDNALAVLVKALEDKEAMVRVEAAHALSRYNSPAAFDILLTALRRNDSENSRFIRQYAAVALGKLGDRRAVPNLIAALKDESELVRPAVAEALGRLGETEAIEPLQRAHHSARHPGGLDCAECKAIDVALSVLTNKPKDSF